MLHMSSRHVSMHRLHFFADHQRTQERTNHLTASMAQQSPQSKLGACYPHLHSWSISQKRTRQRGPSLPHKTVLRVPCLAHLPIGIHRLDTERKDVSLCSLSPPPLSLSPSLPLSLSRSPLSPSLALSLSSLALCLRSPLAVHAHPTLSPSLSNSLPSTDQHSPTSSFLVHLHMHVTRSRSIRPSAYQLESSACMSQLTCTCRVNLPIVAMWSTFCIL
jgi:hypothetical protein